MQPVLRCINSSIGHKQILCNIVMISGLLLASISFQTHRVYADTNKSTYQIEWQPDAVTIYWQSDDTPDLNNSSWSFRQVEGASLPIRLTSTATSSSSLPDIQILEQRSVESAPPLPIEADGNEQNGTSKLPQPKFAAPTNPVFVLRAGSTRGQHTSVIAFSPFFLIAGRWHRITTLTARIGGVSPVRSFAISAAEPETSRASNLPVAPPINPATAQTPMWRIAVAQPGIQRLTGASLSSAGIPIDTTPADLLRVQYQGSDIAAQVLDFDGNGRMDVSDELRFYAKAPGDRWNQTDSYWLTVASQPATRMGVRAANDTGTTRTTAKANGDWQLKTIYDSLIPGPDRDHWFAAQLNSATPSVMAMLKSTLPFTTGTMSVVATGSARQTSANTIRAANQSASRESTQESPLWESTSNEDWVTQFNVNTSANATAMQVQVNSNGAQLALEDVRWQAPVSLSFSQKGAFFTTVSGAWTYQLGGLPTDAMLYDITDWQLPQVVSMSAPGTSLARFGDASEHKYVVAGPGTLFDPALTARTTADLSKPLNGRGIYIAPAALHESLQPLLAHRRANGWLVTLVDTQSIYDSWSYGQVSPQAIRSFLRYADSTWTIAPYAVVLVGDGNYDPLNFTGTAPPSLVPPYLADVDPWLGEAACESCFAQLDGEDPLSDPLPDIYFGRLPAKTAQEVTTMVNKIIGYETAPQEPWMWRNIFISDNFREANGTADNAGNFATFNDRGASMQPMGADVQRAYFRPLCCDDKWNLAHRQSTSSTRPGVVVVEWWRGYRELQWARTHQSVGTHRGHAGQQHQSFVQHRRCGWIKQRHKIAVCSIHGVPHWFVSFAFVGGQQRGRTVGAGTKRRRHRHMELDWHGRDV